MRVGEAAGLERGPGDNQADYELVSKVRKHVFSWQLYVYIIRIIVNFLLCIFGLINCWQIVYNNVLFL